MAKALVCYYSVTGNTEKMAVRIADNLKQEGLTVDLKKVEETDVDELLNYDCLIFGSPTYYGSVAWPIKKFLDESVKFHGRLRGRVGGAFASSANVGGGNETTILSLLQALLIHGMVVCGDDRGDHYGPVSIGKPDRRALRCCETYAKNIAALVKRLFQ
ncbi:MAG: flavodoxin family protein [Candidatus Aminicenantales bacterium]